MSSLTQTAIFSHKAFRWALLTVAVIVSLIVLFMIGMSLKNSFFPSAPLPGTVSFGKIPRMDLTLGIAPTPGTTYQLENISGDLPALSPFFKVFAIAMPEPSFGAQQRIISSALGIGFGQTPQDTGTSLIFRDDEDPSKILTVDILSGNFTFDSGFMNDPKLSSSRSKDAAFAIAEASSFFGRWGISLEDYPEELAQTRMLRIENGVLVDANSLSQSNVVEVTFRPGPIDNAPVILLRENDAPLVALVFDDEVVRAKVNIVPVQKYKFATYPLKGTARAFEELKAGKAAFSKAHAGKISILDVSIGYVVSQNSRDFLQPVYIFGGVDGFAAYVPAVSSEWLKD
ncbi:MAG: hypothetical protein NUV69_02330 [Candidatus Curtissbacteria bacterium]|nr:hypothetical protein [Candidatus Curtissbacteria bacterium]